MAKAYGARLLIGLTAITGLLMIGGAGTVTAVGPGLDGIWLANNGAARIEVKQCEDGRLCNHVVWLKKPTDAAGKALRDRRNQKPELRGRKIMGMSILHDMHQTSDRTWEGMVYDPTRGRSFNAFVTLKDNDRLEVKGCLSPSGSLCLTKVWYRVRTEKQQLAGR